MKSTLTETEQAIHFQSKTITDKFLLLILGTTIFVLPNLFLPVTFYPASLNQQAFAAIAALLLAAVFFGGWLSRAEIALPKSKIFFVLAGMILAAFVSNYFSAAPYKSFFGETGSEAAAFLSLAVSAVFFFALGVLGANENTAKILLKTFAFASALAGLFFLANAIYAKISGSFLLPWPFARFSGFNTVGSLSALAVFVGFGLLTNFGLFLFGENKKSKVIYGAFSLLLLAILIILGNSFVFLGLTAGLALGLILLVSRGNGQNKKTVNFFLFLIALSFIFVFARLPLGFIFNFPPEAGLNSAVSLAVNKGVWSSGPKNLIIGTGPATFVYDFIRYRPIEFSLGDFWGVNFGQGFSFWNAAAAELGVLGFVLLLAFFAASVIKGIKDAMRDRQNLLELRLTTLVVLTFGFIISFFHPFNFVLLFCLFIFSGLIWFYKKEEADEWKISLASTTPKTVVLSLVLIFLIIGAAFGGFNLGRWYLANAVFGKATIAVGSGDLNGAAQKTVKAINFWNKNDFFYRNLSQFLLLNLQRGSISSPQDAQSALANAIFMAQEAKKHNNLEPANYLNLAGIYEALIGTIPGAADSALQAYRELADLYPSHPFYRLKVAQMRLALSDLAEAEKEARKAIDLKANYADAHLLLSQIYEKGGRISDAVRETEAALALSPSNIGVLHRLGILYYRDYGIEKAKAAFERILILDPNNKEAKKALDNLKENKPIE